jgi:organic radical activating enzyme
MPAEGPGLAITATASFNQTRYLSCRFIERAITFYPGKVTACCANPATGMTPTIAPFTGGELSAETLLNGRERIIVRHKAGDISRECQNCPRLTEEEWHRPGALSEHAIDEVTIANFTSCNIRCNYCYTVTRPELAAPLSKQPRILPTFQQLIERNLLAPNATVRFSGGEPTLSPEFEPLLKLLTNHGVRSVVYTNATKRSEAIMEALGKDKVELVLGIDATTVETYKAIKKMNYNEKVWTVVAEYCNALPQNATNKVWAKFIFCLENFHEAAHFVERAHKAGAKHVYYDFDSSRVQIGAERAGIALPEEICEHLAVLRHGCEKRGIHAEFAQSGLIWLTSEREARLRQAIERLRREDASAAA